MKLFGKSDTYPKTVCGMMVDTYYTKRHQENLNFYDDLNEKIKKVRRDFSLEVTGDGEDKKFNIEYICKELGISRRSDDWGISHFEGLGKCLEALKKEKSDEFTRKNGFLYSPHLKKQVNVIYPGQLFEAYSIFQYKVGKIDENTIDEIIKILPKDIEVKKEDIILEKYPTDFRQRLVITLQAGEVVQLVQIEGNVLFFAIDEFSINIYNFCRELYISYIGQFQNNFNKKIISLLDLAVSKDMNLAYKEGLLYDLGKENELRKHKIFYLLFGKYKHYKKWLDFNTMYYSEGIRNNHYDRMYMDLYGKENNSSSMGYDKRGEKFYEKDRNFLQAGEDINWYKYKMSRGVSGPIFIDAIKEFISKSTRNNELSTGDTHLSFEQIWYLFESIHFDFESLFEETFRIKDFFDEYRSFFNIDIKINPEMLRSGMCSLPEEKILEFLLESPMDPVLEDIFTQILRNDIQRKALKGAFIKYMEKPSVCSFYKKVNKLVDLPDYSQNKKSRAYGTYLKEEVIQACISELEQKPKTFSDKPFHFLELNSKELYRYKLGKLAWKVKDFFGDEYVPIFNGLVKEWYEKLDERKLLDLIGECAEDEKRESNFLYLRQHGFYEKVLEVCKKNRESEKVKRMEKQIEKDPYTSRFLYYVFRDINKGK